MAERIVLRGLRSEEYMHPREEEMKHGGDSGLIAKALDMMSDLNAAVMKRMTLGRYVRVDEATAPRLYGLLKEVCRTLDFRDVPRLYITHHAAQNAFCLGAEHMMICMADYLFDHFDDDMMRFMLGNLVGMFKGGHTRLVNVCNLMLGGPATLAFELPLLAYLRAADLSSDRAGLLACQSFSGAARAILWDAGIPLEELASLDEAELIRLAQGYVEDTERCSPGWLNMTSAGWKKLNMEAMPPAFRMRELLAWYQAEYPALMRRYEAR